MIPTTLLACVLAAGPWSGQDVRSMGYVWNADNTKASLYTPQEGDIFLTTSTDKIYAIIWTLGRTGHPYHSTIIVRRTTGELESLEVGGGSSFSVTLRALPERWTSLFQDYHKEEAALWVRRRRTPITLEQSAKLTKFAEAQLNKRLTPVHELLVAVPWRGRLYRSGDPDQASWFCAEILVAAIEQAGLLAGKTIPNPGRIMPTELHHDRMIDLKPEWDPPLRWTGDRTPPIRYQGHPLP